MPSTAIPFPQADSLSRVIAVAEAARTGVTVQGLSEAFGVTRRQARYYADGAAWLGLVRREDNGVQATEQGKRIARLRTTRARIKAIRQVLETKPVFGRAVRTLNSGKVPTRPQLRSWVRQHTGLSPVTSARRALTVAKWSQAVA